jgi:hypothetical protein
LRRDATDGGEMIMGEWHGEDWRLPAPRPGPHRAQVRTAMGSR